MYNGVFYTEKIMHRFFAKTTFILLALGMLLLGACDRSSLNVSADFSSTQDIQAGTPVYFGKSKVGQVSDVQIDGVGSKISISLDKQAAQTIQSNAAVVVNRMKQGMPLEIYNRASFDVTEEQQDPIKEGQALHGLNSMLELGAWIIGDAIQLGVGTASKMVESFQTYLQGEEFEQGKQNLNAQMQTAREVAVVAIQDLQKSLSQAAADFKISEQLAANSITQLGEELAPVIEELAITGAQLVEQVEQLEQSLMQMQPEQKKAGEQLLASLLATIEQLEQSLRQSLATHGQAEPNSSSSSSAADDN